MTASKTATITEAYHNCRILADSLSLLAMHMLILKKTSMVT